MKCPACGCEKSQVIDSRPVEENNSIKRRRECLKCKARFTTYEIIDQQGPPHARVFTARALRGSGEEIGRGTGDRKQRAEEAAAAAALAALKENS